MKKVFSFVCALLLVTALVPALSLAEEAVEPEEVDQAAATEQDVLEENTDEIDADADDQIEFVAEDEEAPDDVQSLTVTFENTYWGDTNFTRTFTKDDYGTALPECDSGFAWLFTYRYSGYPGYYCVPDIISLTGSELYTQKLYDSLTEAASYYGCSENDIEVSALAVYLIYDYASHTLYCDGVEVSDCEFIRFDLGNADNPPTIELAAVIEMSVGDACQLSCGSSFDSDGVIYPISEYGGDYGSYLSWDNGMNWTALAPGDVYILLSTADYNILVHFIITAPDDSTGTVTVSPESSTLDVSATVDKDALATDEDKALIAEGSSVNYVLSVEDANSTALEEDKTALASKAHTLSELISISYLDIDLTKYVDNDEGTPISEANAPFTITVSVPDELLAQTEGTEGTYYVLRMHDGTVDVLDATYNADAKTVSFTTDKFSTYAIIYVANTTTETPDTTAPDNSGTPNTASTTGGAATPKTGDSTPIAAIGLLAVLGATAAVTGAVLRKRED